MAKRESVELEFGFRLSVGPPNNMNKDKKYKTTVTYHDKTKWKGIIETPHGDRNITFHNLTNLIKRCKEKEKDVVD